MLYPENSKPKLLPETFKNPGAEYRATPFWAWNCELKQDLLNRELDYMREMGFGGAHMHVRVGMTTEYLSDEFMGYIKGCTEHCKQNDMLAWLYDEDKWPSGFAGGYVTKEEKYRQKFLLFTPKAQDLPLLASYAVALDQDGYLQNYKRSEKSPNWYAYLKTNEPSNWYNGQTYVDGLMPEAIEKFVEITHDRYFEVVGDEFGKVIPAIFTDEPECGRKETFDSPFDQTGAGLPWTTDFAATYQALYHEDILDFVPELFWNLPDDKISRARYRYHDHCSERFASAFCDVMGDWCEKHGIMLTGHMMAEESLHSQTKFLGDCMRSYRAYQLPGIDMLCDKREFNTAKQAQSACHQYARPGVMSELYGVTNWNFPFYKHKLQGDWQAALGVSVRVPHLYWVSMRGESKRDYPACIGHQSPWYQRYKHLEDHFARVSSAMTRGAPIVNIGVVHPVESFWLHWGPDAQTMAKRNELDERFTQLTDWLLFAQLDFNFICESLLPAQYDPAGDGFAIGAMSYDVVIAPYMETIRSTTLNALKEFEAKGGKVIWLGQAPDYVDAEPAQVEASCLPWSKTTLIKALEPYRLHSVTSNGVNASNIISQRRQDGSGQWLFLCNVYNSDRYYSNMPDFLQIKLEGEWQVTKYDTFTGETLELPCEYSNGATLVDWAAYPQDSFLARLEPGKSNVAAIDEPCWEACGELPPVLPISLEEPNVLVLDMPEHSLNGGAWQPREEILRICDKCKAELNLKNAIAGGCQPWVLKGDPDAIPRHTLKLRHEIQSQVEVDCVQLGIEDLETLQILWNGAAIQPVQESYYIDESIKTVTLGKLNAGVNLLEITVPFGKVTTVENCFLLGDFGVNVRGRNAIITKPVRELAFGDWTKQGLPFYGGNVVYHAQLDLPANGYVLEATHFEQPVLDVDIDGANRGIIAISPWRVELGALEGSHRLDLTACGNRINTFGALHNCNYAETWYGPGAWRSKGFGWTYEYRLHACGVMVAPRLLKKS